MRQVTQGEPSGDPFDRCHKVNSVILLQRSAEQIVEAIERLGTVPAAPSPRGAGKRDAGGWPAPRSEGAAGTVKIILCAPVVKGKKGRHEEDFATLKRNGFVHRKGATSAKLDEIGIIPGSMGTASYIVRDLVEPLVRLVPLASLKG